MKIETKLFGKTALGKTVFEYVMSEENGITVKLISYGAAVRSIILPNGKDIVLGFDSIDGYECHDKYMGAIVGRCANRIGKGRFMLNGKEYNLAVNNGPNHLHGGIIGFDKKVWRGVINDNSVEFFLNAENGEEGYPGNLNVKVIYKLNDNRLDIDYYAVSDLDTVVNITNHTYFNLNGHQNGSIENHLLNIYADEFTEIDEYGCSTGKISSVQDTCFDFRVGKAIGKDIDANCEQIRFGPGYDHNFILKKVYNDVLKKGAEVKSGDVKLTVYTDQTGVHFYSGNYLDEQVHGKGNTVYHKRSGFALETQNWPDAINHKNFPNAVLKKGEIYHRKTIFEFEY